MTRRIIPVTLLVLGLVAILLAVASATIWRPTDTETVTMPARPHTSVVVSDPGVLDAVADEVTVVAQADPEEPVVLAVGRTEDVDAWVGTDAHTRITGLASWEDLKVADVGENAPAEDASATPVPTGTATATATPTAAPTATADADAAQSTVPDPAGSDLWVAESDGTERVELVWDDRPGRWSLLAATDGSGPAPTVSLTWPVDVRTPWLVPGLVVGGLLLLAGAGWLTLNLLTEREEARRAAYAERRARRDEDATEIIPAAMASEGLTRRQLRHEARAENRRRSRSASGASPAEAAGTSGTAEPRATGPAGGARGAGIVPASSRAEELRAGRGPEPEDGVTTTTTASTTTTTGTTAGGATPVPAGPDVADEEAVVEDRTAAGIARGAGIVPASARAADLRAGREPDPSSTEVGRSGAELDRSGTEVERSGTEGPDTDVPGAAAAGSPGWRKMWGFGGPPGRSRRPEGDGDAGTTSEPDGSNVGDDGDDREEQR